MFIDREAELAALEHLYASDRAELFILYGRRRVGKTELVRYFCQGKPNLFFVATLSANADQLASFSQAVWGFTHSEVPEGFTFPSWEAALRALADLPGRPVVVLDEFTYLMNANPALPSILQKVWDSALRHTHVVLILSGSYIGLMEREVLGYQAPLYGRRTGSVLLEPLDVASAAQFFQDYGAEERIEAWAVLGGMPYYLQAFTDRQPVLDNVRERILATTGLLYNEPHLLLLEELREPRNYFSVLRAIAQGNARLNEIRQQARIGDARTVARYLDVLQQLRIVRRRVPATDSQPEKSRRGMYVIDDLFLRFWFRYVHPHQSALALGLVDAVLEQRLRPTFEQHVGWAFEEAARQHVARLAREGRLGWLPERIGAWWDRAGEVDVVAVSDGDGTLLLGECKWSRKPVGRAVVDDLKRKASLVDPAGRWPKVHYAVFARAGFTPELEALAKSEGILLVGPEEITAPQGAS